MGAALVPVVLILVALVLVWLVVRRFTQQEIARSDRLQNADRPTLRYEVPAGQDPTVVVIALREAGYDASPDAILQRSIGSSLRDPALVKRAVALFARWTGELRALYGH